MHHAPSVRRLRRAFPYLNDLRLVQVRDLIHGTADPLQFKPVKTWAESCRHPPKQLDLILEALNVVLKGHGIEPLSLEGVWNSRYFGTVLALYVNTGDPYAPTILYDTELDRFVLSCQGDFLEMLERRHKVKTAA